jgi:ASC-1-like (ASCH) protein
MKKIEKKVWSRYFKEILEGKKTFELRLSDFKVKKGDILILKEWDPKKKKYTGREIKKKVGYVFKFKPEKLPFYSQKDIKKYGLQIISLLD